MNKEFNQDDEVKKIEIEYLEKTINKLKHQADMHYIFLGIGVLVSFLGIVYLAIHPDIIMGSVCIILIGLGIVAYNVILRKQKLLRAKQLNQDLEREKSA